MPKPKKNETKKDFMKRCVPIVVKEGKEQDQAVAICNSIFSKNSEAFYQENKGTNWREAFKKMGIKGPSPEQQDAIQDDNLKKIRHDY